MMDFPVTDIDIKERSPLSLAFVGDSVLELMVRSALVSASRLPPGALHSAAVSVVSARAQHDALAKLEPMLTTEEQNIVRRGRNANKATVSKHATPEQYRASTGLEALLGWLYLQNDLPRLQELFEVIWQQHEKGSC